MTASNVPRRPSDTQPAGAFSTNGPMLLREVLLRMPSLAPAFNRILAGRPASPQEIAAAAAVCASDPQSPQGDLNLETPPHA